MSETIEVNFDRTVPLFPLPDTVLLPHECVPLHIFEPRYRQMVSHCLDESGQIAIATFKPEFRDYEGNGPVPLRQAVCVGQIIRHDRFADGRYLIFLHGVCRARINELLEPSDSRAYRLGRLEPLENHGEPLDPMPKVRSELRRLLSGPRLRRLCDAERLLKCIDSDEISTRAVVELVAHTVVHDTELKYALLAEPQPPRRAGILTRELRVVDRLVRLADQQSFREWPKGISWN